MYFQKDVKHSKDILDANTVNFSAKMLAMKLTK